MPKFVIERNVPGAGKLSDAEIKAMAQKSCSVLAGMQQVQWQHSYVTDNKLFCVYVAPNEAAVKEHAKKGGSPADAVLRVRRVIDPTTAE
jgi:hypothetical protein